MGTGVALGNGELGFSWCLGDTDGGQEGTQGDVGLIKLWDAGGVEKGNAESCQQGLGMLKPGGTFGPQFQGLLWATDQEQEPSRISLH